MVVDHARSGLSGFDLLAVRVSLSFAAAILSSHFVEIPIRQGAFKSWRAWLSAPVAAVACAIGLVFATVTPAGAEAITFPTSASPSQTASAPAGPHDLGPGPTYGYPAAYPRMTSDPAALTPVLFVGDSVSLTLFFGLAKPGVADHLEIIPAA